MSHVLSGAVRDDGLTEDHGPTDVTPGAASASAPGPEVWGHRIGSGLVRPTVAGRDRAGRWDPALFAALAGAGGEGAPGAGLAGLLVPRDLGGGGLSAAQAAAVLEGLGEGARDPGLALAVGAHAVLATVPLRAFGTPWQREHYLPAMADGTWTGAVSLRQTQGGARPLTVTAAPAGAGGWTLDGTVDLVPGAPVAHHLLILARHEDGHGVSAFVVDAGTPGLRIVPGGPAAMPTSSWGTAVLDSCAVPDNAVVGTPGAAGRETGPLLAALDWVFTTAPWVGVMRALTRDCAEHIRRTELFGRPLAHSQSARQTLADLAIRSELSSGLVRGAASRFDLAGRSSLADAAAVRLFAAQALRTVLDGASRLAGVDDLGDDRLIERAHRDALFFSAVGGGAEVLRPVVAASLLELG
ncbi:acyl-CoA dehydrogenase family protein [Actinacidiphila acididurans]|uniref:Acyl-CoA dehydrogenase family protein n=1 Tax=Actinacidiphila acididurans TaxID=2784346 RepID=A0ABS2TVC7_9ACTN|nr:acyl-CoA dehydrogenase family protein [Actinacidiphila acididurans]MBM9507291.1 acyl-CoA dehydrogenase family protein [Actinacidiphila acididurans]